ncbi:MAG: MBL fold metallo-hydrolase, partial [Longimicrobiales bacterium]
MSSAAGGPGAASAAAPRVFLADNAGPLTLDGTRTYVVGERRVAVIDPGPASEPHLAALAVAIGDDSPATILLTHGHADHAAGASALAARIHA